MNPVNRTASLITNGRNFFRATTSKGTGTVSAAPKSCELQGKVYPHGSEIMHGAVIRRCVDGQWQERVNPFITVGP
jgi:hypothetical protein